MNAQRFMQVLNNLDACSEAKEWAEGKSWQEVYNDFRFRPRTEEDERWELSKTLIGKIITAGK